MEDTIKDLLLIDGNNLAHRVFWAFNKTKDLQYKGNMTGLLFGFIKHLIFLRKKYTEFYPVICWDRGYSRRKRESSEAVDRGIVASGYKEQREEKRENASKEDEEKYESFKEQSDQLQKELLPLVNCLQVSVRGVEADDLIYTYSHYVCGMNGKAIVVSSDHDFYQVFVLGDGVIVYDSMRDEVWTRERFELEFGFSTSLWLDYCSLVGDTGDNIFGVNGWGPKTAGDHIRKHGTIDKIIEAVRAKGKLSKREERLLEGTEVIKLARSLKKMDIIKGLPVPKDRDVSYDNLYQSFLNFGFASLLKDIPLLQ